MGSEPRGGVEGEGEATGKERSSRRSGHLPAFIMSVPSTAFMGLLETFFSAGDREERRPPEPK